MDYLCPADSVNTTSLWTAKICHCDWINIIVSLFSTYASVLLTAYLRWVESSREATGKNRLFKNHSFRACLTIFLFLSHWGELADAFLSNAPLHVFFVPSASLALLMSLMLLEHLLERTRHPVLLLVVASFWIVNGATRFFRFILLCHMNVYLDSLRSLTGATVSAICFALAASEFFTVRPETQELKRGEKSKSTPLDVRYCHNEAHFFSRATFYWMNSLLKSGYKTPVELDDLKNLPLSHSAKQLHQNLEYIISQYKDKETTSSIWKYFWIFMETEFCVGGIFKLLGDLAGIVGPLGISVMVNYVAEQKNIVENNSNKQENLHPSVYDLFKNGWTIAFIVFFASIAQSTFSQASTHLVNVKSIDLKVALQSFIYKKSLRLRTMPKLGQHLPNFSKEFGDESKSDEENVDFGNLINLMTNDTANIMSFFWIAHYIWAIPVKMSAIIFLLYTKVGTSAIIGSVATMIILMPLQLMIGKKMSRNTSAVLELSDERLQHLNVLIENIKLLKLLGWEKYYCERILEVRRKELTLLDKDSIFWALLTFFTHASSVLVALLTFGIHYLFSDISLTSDSVFSALALFNQLMVPLFIFPVIIPIIAEARVSYQRISDFFCLSEMVMKREVITKPDKFNKCENPSNYTVSSGMTSINEEDENRISQVKNEFKIHIDAESEFSSADRDKSERNLDIKETADDLDVIDESLTAENVKVSEFDEEKWVLTIEDGFFSWTSVSTEQSLFVKNLNIPVGKIIVIIGNVGSGKTALLSAILGEMPQISGTLKWKRNTSVAYCPQTPWLLNTTIRDNILFGLPFRPQRYAEVLSACALRPDLEILPKKDLTEIGEKGITLSGGQKQRIAIARALYSRANLVILDDPLSSLDLSTAISVFENGIRRIVRRRQRTVVMVTHNLQFLAECHLVIAMEGGKIKAQGQYNETRFSGYELSQSWKEFSHNSDNNTMKEHTAKERWQLIKSIARIRRKSSTATAISSSISCLSEEPNSVRASLSVGQFRKLFEMQSEWKHITHDLPLPTDEFQSSIIDCNSSRRRHSVRKKEIGRASSLQDGHIKISQVMRQYSSPLTTATNKLYRSQRIGRREFIAGFLNIHSEDLAVPTKDQFNFKKSVARVVSSESGLSDLCNDFTDENNSDVGENFSTNLIEEREYGKMRNQIYTTYLKACGVRTAVTYIGITLTWQIVRVNTDFWLSVWVETPENQLMLKNLFMYAFLSIGAIVFSLISHALGQFAGSRARKVLHDSMLVNIIQCPTKLFESTPAGRIFNRFSADIDIIDKKLATTIQRLMQFLLLCSSAIIINAFITPWFVALTIPIILLYYIIQKFYRCSSRELQRIDSITRSSIFSHFTETLSGLPSIRAFGYEDKFLTSFHAKLNNNTNCFLLLHCTNRWLGIVLDYLGGIIVFLAMITALIALHMYPDTITPSLVGLAMNYTLLVPIYLNWVVKFFADCEIYLGAVERVKQYSNLPIEKNVDFSDTDRIPPDWPKDGEIQFHNVTLGYGPSSEPVLTNINLHFPPGQKVGICGRSGSGKSSLALSLFNMLEIQMGKITIDNLDITKIPLSMLRTRGSIIPQDTLLFNGTVRENLDAMGTTTDDQIWTAIEKAHLTEIIETHYHGNLNSEMNGGQSLSAGEKQLFSLARAILQKSPFLIMDEATSNLDARSEQILMSTAQKVFRGKTLLIIAHRLSTVLGCDRIIVLDRGKIMEDGTPSSLMKRNSGIFYNMVRSSEEGFLAP